MSKSCKGCVWESKSRTAFPCLACVRNKGVDSRDAYVKQITTRSYSTPWFEMTTERGAKLRVRCTTRSIITRELVEND